MVEINIKHIAITTLMTFLIILTETHRCILFSDAGYDLYKYRDIFSDHADQPMVPETMANDRDDTDSVCDHPCMDMGFQIYLFKIISGKETSGDLWRP